MQITVCVFAALKSYFRNEFIMEVDEAVSVAQLREKLAALNPLSRTVVLKCRFAINDNFVSPDYVLNHEERICIIPPSSGG